MALTIKHLNGDASFLLSFEPVLAGGAAADGGPQHPAPSPFRILLDPWITGPSTVFHSKISTSTHKRPACVASLQELPEPDLVVISQHKSDHCNEATLRQLPPSGTKTLVLAEPASARVIRSWKYFDRDKVRVIPKWDGDRMRGRQAVTRIPVPPIVPGGEPGEVTVAFIPQRRDISGLHSAVGITYRPPPSPSTSPQTTTISTNQPGILSSSSRADSPVSFLTPPATPKSQKSNLLLPNLRRSSSYLNPDAQASRMRAQRPPLITTTAAPHELRHLAAPPTPTSPSLLSLRSERSGSSLAVSRQLSRLSSATTQVSSSSSSFSSLSTFSAPSGAPTTLSLLFSPHGISYPSLSSYVVNHLAPEAALPLTALLHCFDAVSNPWWLGGNILLGAPAGLRTVSALGARAWISAHDGEKELRGLATGLLRTRRYRREEVIEAVGPPPTQSSGRGDGPGGAGSGGTSPRKGPDNSPSPPPTSTNVGNCSTSSPVSTTQSTTRMTTRDPKRPTEVLALGIGEQVVLSSEGVWNAGSSTIIDRETTPTDSFAVPSEDNTPQKRTASTYLPA